MDKIKEFGDKAYSFVMNNYSNPFFWIILLIIMVVICFTAIADFGNK